MVGEVNAAIEGAVRRLGYNVPTTEQLCGVERDINM